MTVHPGFEVLECVGIWTRTQRARPQEIIVQLGVESLTLRNKDESVITHWSRHILYEFPAPENKAIFSPDPETGEQVIIEDPLMIAVIRGDQYIEDPSQNSAPISFGIPWIKIIALFIILAGIIYYTSEEIIKSTSGIVSAEKRAVIGEHLYSHLLNSESEECQSDAGNSAKKKLLARVVPDLQLDIRIVESVPFMSMSLPSRIVILNAALLEKYDGPEVVAGYIILEAERYRKFDILLPLLVDADLGDLFNLTVGRNIDFEYYRLYADRLLVGNLIEVDLSQVIEEIKKRAFPSIPFGHVYASTGGDAAPFLSDKKYLIDPYMPLLTDNEWQELRNICLN